MPLRRWNQAELLHRTHLVGDEEAENQAAPREIERR